MLPMTDAFHPIQRLPQCRTPQEVHALIEEHGMNWGMAYHVALARCPKTPLGDALRVFW